MSPKYVPYVLLVLLVLLALNGFLVYRFFLSRRQPAAVVSQPVAGYSIDFTNPRYDYQGDQSRFNVDVNLKNIDYQPFLAVLLNCDTSQHQGVGVSVVSGDNQPLYPGSEASWTAQVVLDSDQEEVLNCTYAPQGVFETGKTVTVNF